MSGLKLHLLVMLDGKWKLEIKGECEGIQTEAG